MPVLQSIKNGLRDNLPQEVFQTVRRLKRTVTGNGTLVERKHITLLEKMVRGLIRFILVERFPDVARPRDARSEINKHEFKLYSQNGEDGILLHIFNAIGVTNRTLVEFGIGDGRENNAANLLLNFGWGGLLMDSSFDNCASADLFYRTLIDNSDVKHIKVAQELVTKETINALLEKYNVTGEIDLLSIDIDSNDYWVWDAISSINPRVVVVEYNASFGATQSVTMPNTDEFDRFEHHEKGYYHGVSVAALVKLGEKKGYVFVGCDSSGCNTFFIRKDIATQFTGVSSSQAYYPHARRLKKSTEAEQIKIVGQYPVVTI